MRVCMGGGTGCTYYGRDEPRPERVQPALGHGPPVRLRIGVGVCGVCGRSGRSGLFVDRRVLGSGSSRGATSAVRGAARPAAAVETAERVAAQIFQARCGGEGIAGRSAEAIVRVGVEDGLCEAGGAGAARGVRWCGHGIGMLVMGRTREGRTREDLHVSSSPLGRPGFAPQTARSAAVSANWTNITNIRKTLSWCLEILYRVLCILAHIPTSPLGVLSPANLMPGKFMAISHSLLVLIQ